MIVWLSFALLWGISCRRGMEIVLPDSGNLMTAQTMATDRSSTVYVSYLKGWGVEPLKLEHKNGKIKAKPMTSGQSIGARSKRWASSMVWFPWGEARKKACRLYKCRLYKTSHPSDRGYVYSKKRKEDPSPPSKLQVLDTMNHLQFAPLTTETLCEFLPFFLTYFLQRLTTSKSSFCCVKHSH